MAMNPTSEILPGIISSVVTTGVIVGAASWLLKQWVAERLRQSIEHEYKEKLEELRLKASKEIEAFKVLPAREIESYKADLAKETEALKADLARDAEAFRAKIAKEQNAELERLKAALARAGQEQQTRFETLHSEATEVAKEAYKCLQAAVHAADKHAAVLEWPDGNERHCGLMKVRTAVKALKDYVQPKAVLLPLDVAGAIHNLLSKLDQLAQEFSYADDALRPGYVAPDRWSRLSTTVCDEVWPMFWDVENQLRELLGWPKVGEGRAGTMEPGGDDRALT